MFTLAMQAKVCHAHECAHVLYTEGLCVTMKVALVVTPCQLQPAGLRAHMYVRDHEANVHLGDKGVHHSQTTKLQHQLPFELP